MLPITFSGSIKYIDTRWYKKYYWSKEVLLYAVQHFYAFFVLLDQGYLALSELQDQLTSASPSDYLQILQFSQGPAFPFLVQPVNTRVGQDKTLFAMEQISHDSLLSIFPLFDSTLNDVHALRWEMKRIGGELRMVEIDYGLVLYFLPHSLSDVEKETDSVERTAEVSHEEWELWELGEQGGEVEVCEAVCEAFSFLEFAEQLVVRKNDDVRKGKILQLDSQRQMDFVDVQIPNKQKGFTYVASELCLAIQPFHAFSHPPWVGLLS